MGERENGIVTSLDKISMKLENINNTLKPNRIENKGWDSKIESFILLVDVGCRKKRVTSKKLGFSLFLTGVTLAIATAVVIFTYLTVANMLSYANLLNNTTPSGNQTIPAGLDYLGQQLPNVEAITVSVIAFVVSIMAFLIPFITSASTREEITEEYYNKLAKGISDEDKPFLPLLKELINMKCREPDLSLMENYRNSIRLKSDLFTEQSLLRNLYGSQN